LKSPDSGAAKWIRIDNITGSLETGKEADVIAVDGDPVQDITAMSRVDFVMRAGQTYKTPAGAVLPAEAALAMAAV